MIKEYKTIDDIDMNIYEFDFGKYLNSLYGSNKDSFITSKDFTCNWNISDVFTINLNQIKYNRIYTLFSQFINILTCINHKSLKLYINNKRNIESFFNVKVIDSSFHTDNEIETYSHIKILNYSLSTYYLHHLPPKLLEYLMIEEIVYPNINEYNNLFKIKKYNIEILMKTYYSDDDNFNSIKYKFEFFDIEYFLKINNISFTVIKNLFNPNIYKNGIYKKHRRETFFDFYDDLNTITSFE